MEATPFEQDVPAVATNFTEELTVLPFPGLDTDTLEKARVVDNVHKTKEIHIKTCLFI